MSYKILEQNGNYSIISEYTIIEKLENKNYQLDFNPLNGECFLKNHSELLLPEKLYDFSSKNRQIIINSFNAKNKNLGVLLQGELGTGKSIDAKLLCTTIDLPVIIINKKIPSNVNFTEFLQKIQQNYIVFIDEFEKLFENRMFNTDDVKFHKQDSFLSLMDGLNNKYKKLFIFTTNEDVTKFFINRPSRILYHIKYKGILEENAITIANDLLINKEFTQDLINNLDLNTLTIDLLISIINEVNIQNIPFSEFKSIFNYQKSEEFTEFYFFKDIKVEEGEDIKQELEDYYGHTNFKNYTRLIYDEENYYMTPNKSSKYERVYINRDKTSKILLKAAITQLVF